jgi:hypothetical protein
VHRLRLIFILLATLVVAGCGDGGRESAASSAAVTMLRAVASGDGAAACALLAPETAAAVAQQQETSCAEGVLKEKLPAPGTEEQTQVYGQWAQVRLDDDTVFLAAFPGGWRVVAAACRSRGPEQPYDCEVEGR